MQQTAPFYGDWQFWAFLVAALALVLSQLPPLHTLLRKGNINCEAIDHIFINHNVGIPTGQWHLQLENTGGKQIRVNSISIVFARAGATAFSLPVRSYLETPNQGESIMFTPFRLKAGEQWAHVVNFFLPLSRDEDKELRALQSRIRADISAQKAIPANKEKLCSVNDEEALKASLHFMRRQFIWTHGEYTAELKVNVSNGKSLTRSYSFTLFETESKELFDHSTRYQYGDGIFYSSGEIRGLLLPIQEKSTRPT